MYNITSDTWSTAPSMCLPRIRHSKCALFSYIYAFCGFNTEQKQISSIERLNAKGVIDKKNNCQWELIAESQFEPREFPMVAPLNNH